MEINLKKKNIQEFNALDYNVSDIFEEIVDNSFVLAIKENSNEMRQQFISQGMFETLIFDYPKLII
ncbi:MAG: hypothetical protein Q9M36_03900 [Sulfurovum sp.]|nr:hypothetical protein [Sulfurovum sp.]